MSSVPLGNQPAASAPMLAVRGLKKYFGHGDRPVRAVDDVSFEIAKGEVLGLVGESGSGKSTIGRSVLKLIDPTAGEVWFEGSDLAPLSSRAMRPYRRRLQIIFQDPYASLNPRRRVGDTLDEAMATHGLHPGVARGEADRGAAVARRSRARARAAFSARVLRRAAAADRHRPRACRRAAVHRRRRAGVRARRLDPGAGHQSAVRPARALRPDDAVHLARSRRRRIPVRPDRRALSRQGDGSLAGEGAVQGAQASLHRGAARSVAAAGSGSPPRPAPARRRYPESRRSTVGLRLPHPLSRTRWMRAPRRCRRCAKSRRADSRPASATIFFEAHDEPRTHPCRNARRRNQGLSAFQPCPADLRHRRAALEPFCRRPAATAGRDPRLRARAQSCLDARLHRVHRRAAGAARQDDDGAADLRAAARRGRMGDHRRQRTATRPLRAFWRAPRHHGQSTARRSRGRRGDPPAGRASGPRVPFPHRFAGAAGLDRESRRIATDVAKADGPGRAGRAGRPHRYQDARRGARRRARGRGEQVRRALRPRVLRRACRSPATRAATRSSSTG